MGRFGWGRGDIASDPTLDRLLSIIARCQAESSIRIFRETAMISGIVTPEDHFTAQFLHRREVTRRSYVICGAMVAVGTACFLFGQLIVGWAFVGGGIGCAIGEFATARIFLPRKVRRLHMQQKEFASEVAYKWDAEYLEGRSSTGASKRPWKNYFKLKESESVFLLYQTENIFEMIPKTWFESDAQMDEFRRNAQLAGT